VAERRHGTRVHDLVTRLYIQQQGGSDSIFIDIGVIIGYYTVTALRVGTRTVSFEPSCENVGTLMNTIEEKGLRDKPTLHMNALGYELNRVSMNSTNHFANKSNMHITGSQCVPVSAFPPTDADKYGGTNLYHVEGVSLCGIDHVDGVSHDQVIQSNQRDIVASC